MVLKRLGHPWHLQWQSAMAMAAICRSCDLWNWMGRTLTRHKHPELLFFLFFFYLWGIWKIMCVWAQSPDNSWTEVGNYSQDRELFYVIYKFARFTTPHVITSSLAQRCPIRSNVMGAILIWRIIFLAPFQHHWKQNCWLKLTYE